MRWIWTEENAGSEKGDELEKGGEGPSGSGSSCLTFHLHYYPCSQAWSCHSSLMVVSFLFLFLHSHTFFLVIPNLEIVEMNQRVTPKFSLFNDFCFQLPYLVTLLGANLFPPFDFQCMQMFPFSFLFLL